MSQTRASSPSVHIGAAAAAAGVNVQTLHYYERRGLIRRPPRTASGYRQYPPATVRSVRAIKRAQSLGFTLEEIAELWQTAVQARTSDKGRLRPLARAKTQLKMTINRGHCNGRSLRSTRLRWSRYRGGF